MERRDYHGSSSTMAPPHRSFRYPRTMRGLFFPLFGIWAVTGVWMAGCTDDDLVSTGPKDVLDGSVESSTPPPSPDGGGHVGRDCSNDLDAGDIWEHLECSGLYSDLAAKAVAADVKPY